jgi:hypothetical protein
MLTAGTKWIVYLTLVQWYRASHPGGSWIESRTGELVPICEGEWSGTCFKFSRFRARLWGLYKARYVGHTTIIIKVLTYEVITALSKYQPSEMHCIVLWLGRNFSVDIFCIRTKNYRREFICAPSSGFPNCPPPPACCQVLRATAYNDWATQ